MNMAAQRGRVAGNDKARLGQASGSMTGGASFGAALVIRKGVAMGAAPWAQGRPHEHDMGTGRKLPRAIFVYLNNDTTRKID